MGMNLLGCLLTFFLLIFFIAVAIIGTLWNTLNKLRPNRKPRHEPYGDARHAPENRSPRKGKIIADNEGEYVEFEDVREGKQ